jgi:ABC-2 type transport system ATP-binding protein
MTASAIRVRGLRKSFGDTLVLDGIDFDVTPGTVYALLGPNGAGKTTAVHVLTTLLTPDAGEVSIGGVNLRTDPDGVRAQIGVTGQFSAVDDLLSGEENLRLMADLHHLERGEGRRRIADLLDRFELTDAAGKIAMTYSGGMKRRLDLAMTLVGDPRIVFLDEPTTGVDPRGRRTMWQIVRGLVADGITIFLTTQYLEEADELASRVAMLDHGRIVAEGTPAELKRLVGGGHVRLEFGDVLALEAAAGRLPAARRDPEALALEVPTDGSAETLRLLLDQLDGSAASAEVRIHAPDLDDVFLSLTGQDTPRTEAIR